MGVKEDLEMEEITANWLTLDETATFERVELYSNNLDAAFEKFVPAPYGGSILIFHDSKVTVCAASGVQISTWRWKTAGKIMTCNWTLNQDLIFVIDDGTVLLFSIYGELLKTTSMGQEAKDTKIRDAQIFYSRHSTGVAVLTTSNRFFVVNNIQEPRIRKLYDVEWPQNVKANQNPPSWPWKVLASERQARILVIVSKELMIVNLSEVLIVPLDVNEEVNYAKKIALSPDFSRIAILFDTGLLWLAAVQLQDTQVSIQRIHQSRVNLDLTEITWCGNKDALLGFSVEANQLLILTPKGSSTIVFGMFGFICAVPEIDCARIFTLTSQELVRKLPQSLVEIFSIGSMSPGATLKLASEEFQNRSHRADEYLRKIENDLKQAVEDCLASASIVVDPKYQKILMKAAQFGKAFCKVPILKSVDKFSQICKNLRVLNALREHRIGIPLTMIQYETLSAEVVIDRLLQRRLFPLASKLCDFLQMPSGPSRVLAHWACFKVSQDGDDKDIALAIKKRFKESGKTDISYCDVAAKAADCGKSALAIQLLESESSVSKQVPLLIKLGQEATALSKALSSGDRDLAYSVILHLRKNFSSSDFHMLIRKYPLGRVLYESYCEAHDAEALQDWYVQEDDYHSQALHQIERAMAATRTETRQAILINVQELFKKAKNEPLAALAEDHHKLLKTQRNLEEKMGKDFVGLTLHQTLEDLVMCEDLKMADKIRQDFKLSDRRYAWIKLNTWARTHKWHEIKKYAKQKKIPVPMTQVVKLARQHGGQMAANEFMSEEYLNNEDRFNLSSEFGMYVEAASAAFAGKNVEALTSLEALCAGKDDILKSIQSYKAKLIGVAVTSTWR